MSYRGLKRVLGETSLERKCRLLFGSGLLVLIVGSFLMYRSLNRRVVYDQNRDIARVLIGPVLREKHPPPRVDGAGGPDGGGPPVPVAFGVDDFVPAELPPDLRGYRYQIFPPDPAAAPTGAQPRDAAGWEAIDRLRGGEAEVVQFADDGSQYRYFGAVRAEESCVRCHAHAAAAPGDLLGAVQITLPLMATRRALVRNDVFLLTIALVTTVLAMLAAWAIVRYVIVKPVLHLKDVSDEIARGTLDLRADIRTGDEFEELSQAFNRMLRHLLAMQDELREVNTDLDGKVDELARVNLELYETNRLKDEFLATMSHELRTPLNSILGFSEVLAAAKNLEDKQKRYVGNIRNSGADLLHLINDVLDLAKIESGKLDVSPVEFELRDLISRQLDSMAPMADGKRLHLSGDAAAALPTLFQDRGKLGQILANLLSNAVKFTPPGGEIRVRAWPLGPSQAGAGEFELIVSDTGVGIPLEDQATIFEKFRQGRSSFGTPGSGRSTAMTREHGGTGLGLSIVKELARLLGGEVFLESEYGRGSTFTVRLPVRLEEERAGAGEAAAA